MIGLVCGATMLACVDRQVNDDTSGEGGGTTGEVGDTGGGSGELSGKPTSSGEPATTEPQPGTTGSTTQPGTTGTSGGETTGSFDTCGFLCETGGAIDPCDVFAQDCPEGDKCAPYAEGGGSSWNAAKCVPVTGDGQPGDACIAPEGGVSGFDDCARGVICWDVDAMGHGTCVEMCSGSEAAPVCKGEDSVCNLTSDGVLNLCLPSCDPLIQDCPGDDLCIPVDNTFVCVIDPGDNGQVFDACEFINACDKGLACLPPPAASECDPDVGGCCVPFCDLSQPNVMCPGVGQSCVPFFEEGMAPAKFENVGICAIPE